MFKIEIRDQQVPDFVNQAMAFYAWDVQFQFWAWLVFFVVMLLITLFLAGRWLFDNSAGCALLSIIGIVVTIFLGIAVCNSIEEMKKINVAPKLFLIEHIRAETK